MTAIETLKAERAAIRERLAEIETSRAKLGEADNAVEAARAEIEKFAASHAWASAGARGPRPQPVFGEHAVLEGNLQRALLAADANRTALNTLDAREEAARRELQSVEAKIKEAANRIQVGRLAALAAEIIRSVRKSASPK
jgi:hypothetical protein